MSRPWKFVVKIVVVVAMVGLAGPAAASPVVCQGTVAPGQVEVLVPAEDRDLNGWSLIGGSWYYYVNGTAYKGWLYWGGAWYYLSSGSGAMATDWQRVNGHWYFFGTSGVMYSDAWAWGWGGWHYLTASGAEALDQWIRYRGSWYYLDDTGEMVTGRQIINGSVYFFHPDGRMASGEWAFDTANSFWYYATSGGPLLEAQWLYDGGSWYYFGPGWCEMVTRMYWIDDAWYFFGTDGAMYSNRWFYEPYYGEWHYAQASGALVRSDWLLYKGKWYYFDTWTAMVTGWHQIGDRWYLFDENGVLMS